jgi:hypothetical protein
MNKRLLKERIDNIKSRTEFLDIKQILLKYLSIKDRVYPIELNYGMINNEKEVIKQLNVIVDDYSIYKEGRCYLKAPFNFLAGLLGKFLEKKVG